MIVRKIRWLGLVGLLVLMLASILTALAASNTVPETHLADLQFSINPNDLKPPECAALTLTAIVVCPSAGGNCDGTDASELILGSPVVDTIRAGKGDDCILGGGGDDTIRGDQGTDVCIGGPGLDNVNHPSCETSIQ